MFVITFIPTAVGFRIKICFLTWIWKKRADVLGQPMLGLRNFEFKLDVFWGNDNKTSISFMYPWR